MCSEKMVAVDFHDFPFKTSIKLKNQKGFVIFESGGFFFARGIYDSTERRGDKYVCMRTKNVLSSSRIDKSATQKCPKETLMIDTTHIARQPIIHKKREKRNR
jgi:hypothetical protein